MEVYKMLVTNLKELGEMYKKETDEVNKQVLLSKLSIAITQTFTAGYSIEDVVQMTGWDEEIVIKMREAYDKFMAKKKAS